MAAVNTYGTLNDYRVSTESVYESGSRSTLGAAALVAAIFIGVGAYFFYPLYQRSGDTTPVSVTPSNQMNYQAPAAADSAPSADTMDSAPMLYAPNAIATSPTIPSTDATATRAPAQDSVLGRTVTENKPSVSPAQPAQRTQQPVKPLTRSKSPSESMPTSTGNPATATPEMTTPTPVISPQPVAIDPATDTAQDPMTTQSTQSEVPADVPADVAPDAAIP